MKKQKIMLVAIMAGILLPVTAQTLTYNYAITNGTTGTEEANSVTVDPNGNVYVTGKFSGTVDFDPGSAQIIRTSAGYSDAFVAKFDDVGNFLWVNTYGSTSNDDGISVITDGSNFVYLSGTFTGTVDFDAGSGSVLLSEYPAIDNSGVQWLLGDAFLVKLEPNGNLVWARNFGLPGRDYAWDVVLDKTGNVYLAGLCSNDKSRVDSIDVNPGSSTTWFKKGGAFIAKYSSGGTFLHAGQMGASYAASGGVGFTRWLYNIEIGGLAVNSKNELVVAGYFSREVDFDMTSGSQIRNATRSIVNNNSSYNNDGYFVTYDSAGNYKSVFAFGGNAAYCEFRDVALDATDAIYIAGGMYGSIDFNPSSDTALLTYTGTTSKLDAVILKYTKAGDYRWGSLMGGTGNDLAYSLKVDASGDVYSTGYFSGTADFNPAAGKYNLKTAGVQDIFISKLNQGGKFVWARRIGGTTDDIGKSIAIRQSENTEVISCGFFTNTCDFNQESGTDSRTSNGTRDYYVHKLTQSGTEPAMSITEKTATSVLIFPNPANESILIQLPQSAPKTAYQIADLSGRVLTNGSVMGGLTHLGLQNIPEGLYYLVLKSNEFEEVIKLIKN